MRLKLRYTKDVREKHSGEGRNVGTKTDRREIRRKEEDALSSQRGPRTC